MRTNFDGVIGEITSLPGCSQVGVSHGVFAPKEIRHQGHGRSSNQKRTEYMKTELGYDYALCTVSEGNNVQKKILQKNGWFKLDSFMSEKTDHLVHLYGKEL